MTAVKVLLTRSVHPHPVMVAPNAAALFALLAPRLRHALRCSQALDLTPSDLVQVINLRPATPVEAHVVRIPLARTVSSLRYLSA